MTDSSLNDKRTVSTPVGEQSSARKGPEPPAFQPLLPTRAPSPHLAFIDIDGDERGDGRHSGTAMVYDTTRRMRLAVGKAMLDERGDYVELPPPTRRANRLLALAHFLRLSRPARVQTNWEIFFDPQLLRFDALNEGAVERIDALERAGWKIIFLTSLPDSCFERRSQQMLEAGLLRGEQRGLVCKPACARFLKTHHWKALVVGGTRTHHYLALSDKEYRLLPDLVEFFPWMAKGLLDHYQAEYLLFVDDEAENGRQVTNVLQWFPPQGVQCTLLQSLSQLDPFLEPGALAS